VDRQRLLRLREHALPAQPTARSLQAPGHHHLYPLHHLLNLHDVAGGMSWQQERQPLLCGSTRRAESLERTIAISAETPARCQIEPN